MREASSLSRRGFVGGTLAGIAALAADPAAPARQTRPGNPFVYRFTIGGLEAFSISDCDLALREGLDLMWPAEQRPAMKALMERHGEAPDHLPLYANLLVLRAGAEIAVFDAGFGDVGNPRMGWFRDGLAAAGITPDQVTACFLSHAHADHLNGFVDRGKPFFPKAPLYLLEDELAFWRSPEPDFSKSKRDASRIPGMIREVRSHFEALEPLLRPVKPGTELLGGVVRVEAAPGHTAGHACFRIRAGGEELLHLMDLAHHHLLMFADPSWTIAFDHDPLAAAASRRRYWEDAAETRVRCFGFHLPWPGLGRIVAEPAGYRWWPEAWRWPA